MDLKETKDDTLSDRFYYVPKNLIERIRGNQIITNGDTISNDDNRVISKEDGFNITYDDIIENVSTDDEEDTPTKSPNSIIFDMDDNIYSHLYWNLIITFLNKDKPFRLLEDSNVDLSQLLLMELDDNFETYMYTPIILLILKRYVDFLSND